MKTKKKNTITLDEFTDKHFGKRGTLKREKLERGYEVFKNNFRKTIDRLRLKASDNPPSLAEIT